MGFDPEGGVLGLLAALALIVVFALGLAWVFTTIGLLLRAPNATLNAGFMGPLPAALPLEHIRGALDAARLARGLRRREPDLTVAAERE